MISYPCALCPCPCAQTKLPPGALDLNSSYLPATSYQNARQTPDMIRQVIRSAVQVGGAGPVRPAPSASGSDWLSDSPQCIVEDQHHIAGPGAAPVLQSRPSASSQSLQQAPVHVPYQRLMSYKVVTTMQPSPSGDVRMSSEQESATYRPPLMMNPPAQAGLLQQQQQQQPNQDGVLQLQVPRNWDSTAVGVDTPTSSFNVSPW